MLFNVNNIIYLGLLDHGIPSYQCIISFTALYLKWSSCISCSNTEWGWEGERNLFHPRWRRGLRSIWAKSTRFMNSYFLQAIRFLNRSAWCPPHLISLLSLHSASLPTIPTAFSHFTKEMITSTSHLNVIFWRILLCNIVQFLVSVMIPVYCL